MNRDNTIGYYKSIRLDALTEEEYNTLKDAGVLRTIYPEATGIYEEDMNKESRIDNIGQNGNDGEGYSVDEVVPTFPQEGNVHPTYRVPMSDNPDGVNIDGSWDWPHVGGDSYSDKIKKTIEDTYELPKDNMFVDDYVEAVDCPHHYTLGKFEIEAIDVIEAVLGTPEAIACLSPNQGSYYANVLKYMLRAPQKGKLEDLKKAKKYLSWLICSLEVAE